VIRSVTAFTRSYDYWYDRYQRYYRTGLRRECARRGITYREVGLTRATRVLRTVRGWRDRYLSRLSVKAVVARSRRGCTGAWRGRSGRPRRSFTTPSGSTSSRRTEAVSTASCIDAADYPTLPSDELVAWSDLYFKSNRWPWQVYPAKVLPLVNGDPLILRRIESLRRAGQTPKEWDVCFVVRVWGAGRRRRNRT
jgi:hypothetical protein